MTTHLSEAWGDLDLLSLLKSRFLLPSIAIHLLGVYMVLGLKPVAPKDVSTPVPIQLLELGEGSSLDKSIGPGRGPSGPRPLPKLGNPAPPRQQSGNMDKGSVESTIPSKESTPAPKTPVLPGPKILAEAARPESPAVKETSPDALVQLPTRQSSGNLPAAAHTETDQKSLATVDAANEAAGIRALKGGSQIPGALRGNGSGTGPYGVPGGSQTGTGLVGGGSGSGAGGGSYTGLKGALNADYNQYLKQLEKRVNSVWRYPEGVSGVQTVTVRFTLDRAGRLSQAEVLESSDSRLNASAIDAMKRASPFPPIPESLKDLAGEPLRIRFNVSIRLRG
jgi:TonB family protein